MLKSFQVSLEDGEEDLFYTEADKVFMHFHPGSRVNIKGSLVQQVPPMSCDVSCKQLYPSAAESKEMRVDGTAVMFFQSFALLYCWLHCCCQRCLAAPKTPCTSVYA